MLLKPLWEVGQTVNPVKEASHLDSSATLARVVADLRLLNERTEQDFLKIGSKLAEFIGSANSISTELLSLANSDQGQRVFQALTVAQQHTQNKKASLSLRDGGLVDMRRDVAALQRTLSGFQGTLSTFHTLGFLTRIETARLGSIGSDFSSLADEVDLIAKQVHSSVDNALAITTSLIPPIENGMSLTAKLEAEQARDLPALFARTAAGLSSFREMKDRGRASSIRLGEQFSAVSDTFKKLIVSMQFHDITRQQVEHVGEVLQLLQAKADGDVSRPPGAIATVLALQSAQLADAASKFATSVVSIKSSLEDVSRHVLAMANESRAVIGIIEDGVGAECLPIEGDCVAILDGLSQTEAAEALMLSARDTLSESICLMRAPLREIQKLEIGIRRMALNARIKANHLGEIGSVLDVLAGAVQQLALDCKERSEILMESLDSMTVAMDRSGEEGGVDAIGEIKQEMRESVADFHSSTKSNLTVISKITARSDRLAVEIAETLASFSVGPLFAETVHRAQESIQALGEREPTGTLPEVDTDISRFVGRYTMQAERDVYEGFTGGLAPRSTVQASSSEIPQEDNDEVGAGVEFF